MNSPCTHESLSPAVQRCCDARNHMIELDRNGKPEDIPQPPEDLHTNLESRLMYQLRAKHFLNDRAPSLAYRSAMPEPTSRRNIKAFVACVMHGIAIQAITQQEARNMLYGTRTATLALGRRNKPKTQEEPAADPNATEFDLYQAAFEKVKKQLDQNKTALRQHPE